MSNKEKYKKRQIIFHTIKYTIERGADNVNFKYDCCVLRFENKVKRKIYGKAK